MADLPPSPPGPPPAVTDEALAMARSLLQSGGAQDVQRLTLALGAPAARILFQQLLLAAGIEDAEARATADAALVEDTEATEDGCIRLVVQRGGAAVTAYLVLDACPPDHDLGAQLERIRPLVPPEQWSQVTQRMSEMLFVARDVYHKIAAAREPFIRTIFRVPPDLPTPFLKTAVDVANTSIFLHPKWPERVGFFVRFADELGEDGAPRPPGPAGGPKKGGAGRRGQPRLRGPKPARR